MKILCFGDSNTYGYDPRSCLGGRYDHPWPELLAEKSGWQVLNQGENGREIPKAAVAFPQDTDLLIIMLGTNDLLQFWTPEAAAEKMENFLAPLTLDRKKILLLAPPPMTYGEWVQDQELIEDAVSLGNRYEALAQRMGIRFARIDCGPMMAHDGVHLTEEGHRTFSADLYNYLTQGECICCKQE